jgi:hypothetical protein
VAKLTTCRTRTEEWNDAKVFEVKPKSPRAKSARSPEKLAKAESRDVVLIHGVAEDGAMAVLRARNDRVEAGVMRSVKPGEAVTGELVQLRPRPECPLLCDVEASVPAGTVNAAGGSDRTPERVTHGGPAQVATPSYRANWDAIWSKPRGSAKKALPN